MAPEVVAGLRRLAGLVVVAVVLLASCGGASAGSGDEGSVGAVGSTTTTSVAAMTSTTAPSTTTVAPTTTTTTTPPPPPVESDSGLPLVPTTQPTIPDPMVDPPPAVVDPPGPPGRNSVFVLGDSVFLGTTAAIPSALPEWLVTYDAVGNRRLAQGIDVLAARRGQIGEAVVVHLGNNFIEGERGTYATQIDEAMAVLQDVPRVVWVTVSEVSESRVAINQAIREAAARWPNLRVAEWAPIIGARPELSWDGLHLTPTGRREMAALIAQVLGPVVAP